MMGYVLQVLAIGLALGALALAITAFWHLRECQKHLDRMDGLLEAQRERLAYHRALLTPFDHDGDGKPGGSKPRGKG